MDKTIRVIDVLLFDGINLLDVSGPVQAFAEACLRGHRAYEVRFLVVPGMTVGSTVRSSCGLLLQAQGTASLASPASDLLVPGGQGIDDLIGCADLRELISQWRSTRQDARILSVCSGALLLADAGVLDGQGATTHWARETMVRQRFPNVDWRLDEIMVATDGLFTSAGVTTGIDLALGIIREDCGTQAALAVARELVVYLRRSGGQSQYAQIIEWQFNDDKRLAQLVNRIVAQPAHNWTLSIMAEEADMTARTLTRKFTAAFDTSPVRFVEQLRVRLAGDMLSAGVPAARVASRTGLGDVQTLRRAFKRQLGTTVGEYSRRFAIHPVPHHVQSIE
jgi:transcriptional regulator GlxA family with amidase domain